MEEADKKDLAARATTTSVTVKPNGSGTVELSGAQGESLNAWQTPGPAAFDFRSMQLNSSCSIYFFT